MPFYKFTIYAKSDFEEIDFNGDIVTKSVITPITITVEDNDTWLGGNPGTFAEDTNGQQTIVSSSDPSLVGLAVKVNSVGSSATHSWQNSSTSEYTRILDIAIGGNADYLMRLENNVNSEMTPSTTYTESYSVGTSQVNYSAATMVCFTAGTLISTPSGQVPVERLAVGDPVMTMDRGAQPVRWITGRLLDRAALDARPNLYPVRIAAGAIGTGLPRRDLLVSPQHRMLVRSRIAGRVFGVEEVLIPAKKLLGLPGVEIERNIGSVTYYHFMCDAHEIVFAENCPTETLYPGPEMQRTLYPEVLEELRAAFPDALADADAWPRARAFAKGKKLDALITRHVRNGQPPYRG